MTKSFSQQLKRLAEAEEILKQVKGGNMTVSVKQGTASKNKTLSAGQSVVDNDKPKLTKTELKMLEKKQIEAVKEYNAVASIAELADVYHNKFDEKSQELFCKGINEALVYLPVSESKFSLQLLKIIYPMRNLLKKEYDITTKSETMLLDSAMISYHRFLVFNQWIETYLNSGISSEKALIVERFQKMSDNSLNQYVRIMDVIRSMRLTAVNVNIKNSQVNVGQHQQIIKMDGQESNNQENDKSNNFGNQGKGDGGQNLLQ
jgi:hypothetical protein